MGESILSTTHIEIFIGIVAALIPIWLDLRHQAAKNRQVAMENNTAIEKRFTALETMIKPLWDWFTNGRN